MKYTHTDCVQTLSFNPVTNKLFSAGNSDYALFTPENNNFEKFKYTTRILCSSWSPNGNHIAFATIDGIISLRDSNLVEFV